MKTNRLIIVLLVVMVQLACKTQTNKVNNHPETALGWKLGAQAYTFKLFSFTQALDKIDSCGLRYVEAYPQQVIGGGINEKMDFHMSAESKAYVQKLLKAKGIRLVSYGVIKTKDSSDWEKIFAFAKSLGAENITCEPEEKDIPLVSQLCDKYEMNAAIHNHPNPSFYWNPQTVLNTIKGKSKRMGACADIGHWVRSGLDPVKALQQLEGHVIQLHVKDLNEFGNVKAHDVYWGTGFSNIKGVITELKRQNFKGVLSAEYEYNWENSVPDVSTSVNNFRKIVKENQ